MRTPALLSKHQQGILALLLANAIWGAAPAIFKLALITITPFTLAFLRFFVASLLIFPFAAGKLYVSRKDWKAVVSMSLFGITMNIAFFFFGLLWAPSVNAAVIATSAPIFLCLASFIFLHERPHKKILIGIVTGIIGISLIIGHPTGGMGSSEMIGNIFFIIATMGSIGYTIISKTLSRHYAPVTLIFWSFFIGSLTFFPFFLYESVRFHPLSSMDTNGFTGLLFGIFFSSALAYYLYEWGLQKIETQEVGLFASVDPIIAAVFSMLLLGETIPPFGIIGTACVFVGLFIAELHVPYAVLRTWKHWKRVAALAVEPLTPSST